MHDIHLHGALGQEFGRHHRFDVDSVIDVISALRANFPKFTNALRHGFYRVVLGKLKGGIQLDEEAALITRLNGREVHIIPVTAGHKRGGLGKVIAGIALVGLSTISGGTIGAVMGSTLWSGGATVGTMVGNMGVSMMLTGVATMIAPEQDAPDEKKSFTMTGPTSNMREGNIIPIVYGEVITGGYMIAGGLEIDGPANSLPPSVSENPNNGAGGSAADTDWISGD